MTSLIIASSKINGQVEFGVMSVPSRKNKMLYIMRGCNAVPLAYFRNDDKAEEFEKILSLIYEVTKCMNKKATTDISDGL